MRAGFQRPIPALLLVALVVACGNTTPSTPGTDSAPPGVAASSSLAATSAGPGPESVVPSTSAPIANGSPPPSATPSQPAPPEHWLRVQPSAIEQPGALTQVPLDSAGNPLGACGTCHPPIATVMVDGVDGPAGLVAVGYELPDFSAAAWWSADGSRWSLEAKAFSGISMLSSVAADSHGYVAVGRNGDGAGTWHSSDGQSWSRSPDTGGIATPTLRLASVTRWRGGFAAVGYVGPEFGAADAAFLVSADGVNWTLAPSTVGMRSARAVSVAAGGPGLVAVGSTGMAGSHSPAAVWTSADGLRWDRIPDSPALHDLRLRAVAADGRSGGVIAMGENLVGSIGAVLRSRDGIAWQRPVPDGSFGRPGIQVRLYGVTVTTARGLVVGGVVNEGIQYGVAGIWSSPDGASWTLEPTSEMLSDGEINALVAHGTQVLGLGDRGAPDAYVATVWQSPAGWAP